MRILYYYWGELIITSVQEALRNLNVDVKIISPKRTAYDFDISFMSAVLDEIKNDRDQPSYDALFSFNYYPDLSRVAMECGVKYISWVYDSPHLTLDSNTLNNQCNTVYIFDYALCQKYAELGIKTIKYMPLPCRVVDDNIVSYEHAISFVGSLYDDEQDQYGMIGYLPDYIDGYLDALINAQQHIYGADLFSTLVGNQMFGIISDYVKLEMGENYRKCEIEIFRDMLRRRVTMNERKGALLTLGKIFGADNIALYCGKSHPELPVKNMGIADYATDMINVFASSKINLNITLRSIQTGIPLRVMDILGAGGFCLTNYQAELEEYFENGVDLVWYESIDDLVEKCRFYLEHEEERIKIAATGHLKAKRLFEFRQMFERVLNSEDWI